MATFTNETHGWKLVLKGEILQEDLENFDDYISKSKTDRRSQENGVLVKAAIVAKWIEEVSPTIKDAESIGKANPKFIGWLANQIRPVYYDLLTVPND